MGPLTTADSVPVTPGAVLTLGRCVVVSRGEIPTASPARSPGARFAN